MQVATHQTPPVVAKIQAAMDRRPTCPVCDAGTIAYTVTDRVRLKCSNGCAGATIASHLGVTMDELTAPIGEPPTPAPKVPPPPPRVEPPRSLPGPTEMTTQGAVTLIEAATIRPEAVDWLWDGWLARGKVHILAGAPGTGKTTAALGLGACVTLGGRWPDGTWADLGDVLLWSGEDDATDTLVPRLLAAGADLSRVRFVASTLDERGPRAFDPATDMGALSEAIADRPPDLLVIDPVVSAISGDSHKNAEVRRAMQPLVDLAAVRRCAVLGITHLTKGTQGRDPTERVTGSLAFGAVARVVLVAAKIRKEEGGGRMLARAKSNLGPDGGGFGYDLAVTDLPGHPGLSAARVLWGEALTGTAHELLGQAEADADPEERTALDDAQGFLLAVLADGPVTAKAIQAEARDAGHAWATVRRAQNALGIEARKDGVRGPWKWYPPQDAHPPAQGAQHVGMSALGNLSAFQDAQTPQDAHTPEDGMSILGEALQHKGSIQGAHMGIFQDAHQNLFGEDEHLGDQATPITEPWEDTL